MKPLRVSIRDDERVGSRQLTTFANNRSADALVTPRHQQEMRWTHSRERLERVNHTRVKIVGGRLPASASADRPDDDWMIRGDQAAPVELDQRPVQ
jgi:hypothetical protein